MARGVEGGARGGAGSKTGAGAETGVSTITIARGSNNLGRSEVSINTQPKSFLDSVRTLGGKNVELSEVRNGRLNYFANMQVSAREAQKSALGTHTESPITPGNSFRSIGRTLGGENVPLRLVGKTRINCSAASYGVLHQIQPQLIFV
jgi:hypothetical protein